MIEKLKERRKALCHSGSVAGRQQPRTPPSGASGTPVTPRCLVWTAPERLACRMARRNNAAVVRRGPGWARLARFSLSVGTHGRRSRPPCHTRPAAARPSPSGSCCRPPRRRRECRARPGGSRYRWAGRRRLAGRRRRARRTSAPGGPRRIAGRLAQPKEQAGREQTTRLDAW